MRILQVGWGWPPQQGGGPVVNMRNLAYEYSRRGQQVFVFVTGAHSVLRAGCHLRVSREGEIEVAHLLNAPNAVFWATDPLADVYEPVTDGFLRRYLAAVCPDVVHFHNLVGFPVSVLGAAESAGIPVVVSLHNYWLICQRTTLYKSEGEICQGPEPMKCARCRFQELKVGRRGRLLAYLRDPLASILKSQSALKRRLRALYRRMVGWGSLHAGEEGLAASSPVALEALAYQYDIRTTMLHQSAIASRAYFQAPSSFVRDRFVAFGISAERIRVIHPDVSASAVFARAGKSPLPYKSKGLVTFGYFQGFLPYKGIEVAVRAFSQSTVREAKLLLFGCDPQDSQAEKIRKLYDPSVPIIFAGGYNPEDLAEVYAQVDVAVVPPLWYDNAPQVVLEALAAGRPVLGSRIGGIPDFVTDGVNGFLFGPGNARELAAKMKWFCENRGEIEAMANRIMPPKTTSEHGSEMLAWYEGLRKLRVGGRG